MRVCARAYACVCVCVTLPCLYARMLVGIRSCMERAWREGEDGGDDNSEGCESESEGESEGEDEGDRNGTVRVRVRSTNTVSAHTSIKPFW